MNYDFTLMSKAQHTPARPLPTDVRELRDHIGPSAPRSIQLRQSLSNWLVQLAARIAPRPARTERDELFDAIAALLAEPATNCSRLDSASHQGC